MCVLIRAGHFERSRDVACRLTASISLVIFRLGLEMQVGLIDLLSALVLDLSVTGRHHDDSHGSYKGLREKAEMGDIYRLG